MSGVWAAPCGCETLENVESLPLAFRLPGQRRPRNSKIFILNHSPPTVADDVKLTQVAIMIQKLFHVSQFSYFSFIVAARLVEPVNRLCCTHVSRSCLHCAYDGRCYESDESQSFEGLKLRVRSHVCVRTKFAIARVLISLRFRQSKSHIR